MKIMSIVATRMDASRLRKLTPAVELEGATVTSFFLQFLELLKICMTGCEILRILAFRPGTFSLSAWNIQIVIELLNTEILNFRQNLFF